SSVWRTSLPSRVRTASASWPMWARGVFDPRPQRRSLVDCEGRQTRRDPGNAVTAAPLTFQVTDASNPPLTATAFLTLTVTAQQTTVPLTITTAALAVIAFDVADASGPRAEHRLHFNGAPSR